MRSPYEVLGLRSGASPKEIQKSYRRLAKLWHPDRFPDAARRKEAEEKMRALNEAYRTLSSGETPPPVGRVPERQARPPRKSLWPGAAAALAAAAVLFAALYAFFHFREDAGKLIVNGVSFREWEWERSFRIGSTKDEVLAVQGPPTYTAGEQWYYGNDIVTFSGGRVAAFSNVSGSLKVSRRTSSETNNQLNLIK